MTEMTASGDIVLVATKPKPRPLQYYFTSSLYAKDKSVHLAASPNNGSLPPPLLSPKEETRSVEGSPELSEQPFRFMDLPLEVRNMIFFELLVLPGPIAFDTFTMPSWIAEEKYSGYARFYDPTYPSVLAWGAPAKSYRYALYDHYSDKCIIRQSDLFSIFMASKTIYREAVPVFFGRNLFQFVRLDHWETFHSKLGQEYRWQLTCVDICCKGRAPAKAIKLLLDCMGLKELTLRINHNSVCSCTTTAPYEPRLYGMNDLLRIRGLSMLNLIISDLLCYNPRCKHHLPPEAPNYQYWYDYTEEGISAFKQRLEVLKQPRDPKNLKRQENKDFNSKVTKAERTVFGEANVVTRSERRMLDKKQNAPNA